jgi:hypothetical protein
MAERLAVLMKPGNAGGGKGPQLKADEATIGREIGDEPDNSPAVFKSCMITASNSPCDATSRFPVLER